MMMIYRCIQVEAAKFRGVSTKLVTVGTGYFIDTDNLRKYYGDVVVMFHDKACFDDVEQQLRGISVCNLSTS